MSITLESLQTEIESLNKKMDTILELLKTKQSPKKEINQEPVEKTWSVEDYKNCILLSFPFNLEFKEYIKEIGGKWMVSKKSWMFPKAESESITEQISEKFPDWKLL
jgi:hypothetical protein